MLRLSLALFACLLLPSSAGKRAVAITATLSFEADSAAQDAQTTPQSAELEEARQLNQRVVQLFKEGKVDEALSLAKRVFAIREKALGKEHELVIEALLNLAELNLSKGDYGQSLSIFERILKSSEKQAGPLDASLVVLLDKMAYLRYMMGDFAGAENAYRRSLAIDEKIFSPESEQVAQSLYNLAEFYRFTSSYQKAEPLYQRALAIRDKTLALDDPRLTRTADRYRCLFYQSERMDKLKAFDAERSSRYKSDKEGGAVDIINGRALSLPKPPYPPEAKAVRAKGIVVIKVTIDESGGVVKAEDMCGGYSWLVRAATEAAFKARFSPTMLSGQPVKVTGLITYKFSL